MLSGVSTSVLSDISIASFEAVLIAVSLLVLIAGFSLFNYIRNSIYDKTDDSGSGENFIDLASQAELDQMEDDEAFIELASQDELDQMEDDELHDAWADELSSRG